MRIGIYCTRGSIKHSDGAVRGAQEAAHSRWEGGGGAEESDDGPRRVDGVRTGIKCTRGIKHGDGAIVGAQKAVPDAPDVKELPRDRSRWIYGIGLSEYGAQGIEGVEGTVGGT